MRSELWWLFARDSYLTFGATIKLAFNRLTTGIPKIIGVTG
jgi:hypothetical protein